RVASVPEREREAEAPVVVADAEETVLAPTVRAAPRVVVREVVPRGAVRAVVLADGAPLALGQIRAPGLPGPVARRLDIEPPLFRVGSFHRPKAPRWTSSRRRPDPTNRPGRTSSSRPPSHRSSRRGPSRRRRRAG